VATAPAAIPRRCRRNVDFLDVAARLGASAALQKPFTCADLLKAIDESFCARQVA
jgi:hypothetical protein